jgi:RNA 2',3'-cyclic 3'-phosphodiesterase
VEDLFPDSLDPRSIGFGAIRLMAPMFFAIYPLEEDLHRIVEWQHRMCRLVAPPSVDLRPPALLHISVAACGAPKQQRQPLELALRSAAQRFSCSPFELTLNATARFGKDSRAFVAVTDEASARHVHWLRLALADAQKPFGLSGARGMSEPHLTLGYRDNLPAERRPVEPICFRVEAVDLVVSDVGRSKHLHIARWPLV